VRLLFTEGDFKREDLARTVLNYSIVEFVHLTQLVALCNDVKRVFFTGGFCSVPLIRRVITGEYLRRNVFQYLKGKVGAKALTVCA